MKGRYRDRTFHSHTSQSEILKSGYTVEQTWKALSNAWLGYTIAKNKGEQERMGHYASVIQKLQRTSGCRYCRSTISGKISASRYAVTNQKTNWK